MWVLEQLDPDTSLFGIGFAVKMLAQYDRDRLRRSLEAVVDHHPALRIRIGVVDGVPLQSVARSSAVDIRIEPATGWTIAELRARGRPVHGRAFRPRKWSSGPVPCAGGRRRGSDRGGRVAPRCRRPWSITAAVTRPRQQLRLPSSVNPPPDPRTRTFADFVTAERRCSTEDQDGPHSISGGPSSPSRGRSLIWPPSRRPPSRVSPAGRHVERVPRSEVDRWKAAAEECGTDLHDLILAGYLAAVHRYTGQSDLVVGTFRGQPGTSRHEYRRLLSQPDRVAGGGRRPTRLRRPGRACGIGSRTLTTPPASVGAGRDRGDPRAGLRW